MKINGKKGISLIVLVITIIVIVILAVAVILTIAQNNPIENAREAVEANDEATLKEAANLAYAEWYTEKSLNKTNKEADEYVESELVSQGLMNEETEAVLITNENVYVVKEPVIPNGFVASDIETEDEISEGLVIYEDTEKVSTDEDAKTTRNQFVWVPVPEGTFVRENGYYNGKVQTWVSSGNVTEPYSYNDAVASATEIAEYNAMKASVEKYGGFYIARYEASKADTPIAEGSTLCMPESKKDKSVYNKIGFSNSNDINVQTGGAAEVSREMYSVEDATTGDPVSTLIYGTQWDATVRWLDESGYNIIDSSTWGNYRNNNVRDQVDPNEPAITGAHENWKAQNIYDLAGNVTEWTMEVYGSEYRIDRGSFYSNTGAKNPASNRNGSFPNTSVVNLGFRVALYIK